MESLAKGSVFSELKGYIDSREKENLVLRENTRFAHRCACVPLCAYSCSPWAWIYWHKLDKAQCEDSSKTEL